MLPTVAGDGGSVGIISAAIAALSTLTTPQFAGLLAGLPTLGLVTIVRLHRAEGVACVTPFLRGYVISTLGRVMFGTVYALMAVAAGSTAAMIVAIVAGSLLCLAAVASMEAVSEAAARP